MSEIATSNNVSLAVVRLAPTYVYCFIHGSVCYLTSMLMVAILLIFPGIKPDTRPVEQALTEKREKLIAMRRAQARGCTSEGSTTLCESSVDSSGSSVYPPSVEESDSSFASFKQSLKSTMRLRCSFSTNIMKKEKSCQIPDSEDPNSDGESLGCGQSKPRLTRHLSKLANIPAASGDLMSNMVKPFKPNGRPRSRSVPLRCATGECEAFVEGSSADTDSRLPKHRPRSKSITIMEQARPRGEDSTEDDDPVDEIRSGAAALADITLRPVAAAAGNVRKGAHHVHKATARTMQDGARQMQDTARTVHQTTVRGMQQTTRQVKDATTSMQQGTTRGIETTGRCVKSTALTVHQGTVKGLETTARGVKDVAHIVQETTFRSVKNAGKSLKEGSSCITRPFRARGNSQKQQDVEPGSVEMERDDTFEPVQRSQRLEEL